MFSNFFSPENRAFYRRVWKNTVAPGRPQMVIYIYFLFGATAPQLARAYSFTRFLDHTQRRTTVGRTPLDE